MSLVANPGFPTGANQEEGTNVLFDKMFAKSAWKWKNRTEKSGVSLVTPLYAPDPVQVHWKVEEDVTPCRNFSNFFL